MPKRKRTAMKREMAQAIHHLETAKNDVGEVWAEFDGVHDDYAASLLMLGQAIGLIQEGIKKFWTQAWGKLPDNFDSYRC